MPTINVSPFATNVLDLIDVRLRTKDGRRVDVSRSGIAFRIRVDLRTVHITDDNVEASRYLNQLEVEYAG